MATMIKPEETSWQATAADNNLDCINTRPSVSYWLRRVGGRPYTTLRRPAIMQMRRCTDSCPLLTDVIYMPCLCILNGHMDSAVDVLCGGHDTSLLGILPDVSSDLCHNSLCLRVSLVDCFRLYTTFL